MMSTSSVPTKQPARGQAETSSLQPSSQPARATKKREMEQSSKQPSAKKPKAKAPPKPWETEEESTNRRLLMAGYQNPEKSNKCVRAGLARGKFSIKFTGEAAQLDAVVMQTKCWKNVPDGSGGTKRCKGVYKATIRKLLDQPELCGFEKGCPGGPPTVFCSSCNAGHYVTNCCYPGPHWLSSERSHFHCRKCPKMGRCWDDFRWEHCDKCDRHFYTLTRSGRCYCGWINVDPFKRPAEEANE